MAKPEDTPKGQHFLLSPECRTLTAFDLARMRDTTAYNWFKRLRWHETEGEAYCPKCGTLRCHTMSRNRFKCTEKTCKTVFSITSRHGVPCAQAELQEDAYRHLVLGELGEGQGRSPALTRDRASYKTAWVLPMKLRKAIAWRSEEMVLDGEVESDGKYAGGHIRPENKAEDRIDRRLKKSQNMKRLCALASDPPARTRRGCEPWNLRLRLGIALGAHQQEAPALPKTTKVLDDYRHGEWLEQVVQFAKSSMAAS